MVNKMYWVKLVDDLVDTKNANSAAHIFWSNIDNFDEILTVVGKEVFIKNCLLCYSVDFSAQPYLDKILSNFTTQELLSAYKSLKKKPINTAGALMWLLEDLDPEFERMFIFKDGSGV